MLNINILNINPQFVCHFLQKAKEFHGKEDVSFPEESLNIEYETDPSQMLANHVEDLTYIEIKEAVDELSYKEKVNLLALMYLGRGDFEPEEWDEALVEAMDNVGNSLTDYLLSHPYLSDYLENALEQLNYACDE